MLLIVGPYPPPRGGISTHIERLADRCQAASITTEVVSPYGPKSAADPPFVNRITGPGWRRAMTLQQTIRCHEASVVHVHVSAFERLTWVGPVMRWAIGTRPWILTIHSGSWPTRDHSFSGLGGRALLHFIASAHTVIAVNDLQAKVLEEVCRSVVVIPAYLSAPTADPETMPAALRTVINRARESGRRILLSSGYGKALYRYEDVLTAVREGGTAHLWQVILATYTDFDEDYIASVEAAADSVPLIIERGLSPAEFQALLAEADVYVRATTHDGDAVAIREALALGIPVIASDAAPRPSGVRTYPVADVATLGRLLDTLEHAGPKALACETATDNWQGLQAIYADVGL